MKRLTNRKWISIWTVVVCLTGSALIAGAQELDLEVLDVGVELIGDNIYLHPQVRLTNAGNLAGHLLQIAIQYGPVMVEQLESGVEYVQENHTCWEYSFLNCGNGECLDIVTFSAFWEGYCMSSPWFLNCACAYVIEPFVEPIPLSEPTQLTVTVDPNGLVPEVDEDNNVFTINLEPIEAESSSWTLIKDMYR